MQSAEREKYIGLIENYRTRFYKDEFWVNALMKLNQYKEPHFSLLKNLKYVDNK